ncbi:hypothetical protein PGIGA_G00041820 [Pangasianodon gigas]|uniref:Uncharacterized protein n=1 Tax=Pangasianodon gigas TaxID=30993 RepID=A0ACC5X063_PANGG|nr:hypothetical protein [Pangasianodon gigas]
MMKTSAVSLTVWFAQVLTLCALHENLLTTQELDVSITTSEKLTTNQDVRTKTETMTVMTTTMSAEELLSDWTPHLTPTLEMNGFTSSVEDERRNNMISTSHHNIMSPTEMAVSTNTTSVMTEYQETRTGTESTSLNIQEMTEISTSGTSIQLDHDVQTTTSTSWTEDRTSDTDEANATTLIHSTNETDVTLTSGSYDTTDHQSPAPTTAGTSLEIFSTNQTHPDDTTNTVTPTGTSGRINITATPVRSTQVTSGSTENTEEPLVSSTKMMDWETEENTEALATTRGNVYENTSNTTWRDGTWSMNPEDTWSTSTTTTSKNISTSETPHWTNCFDEDSSPQPRRFSKLVCFITLWTLTMIASIFLGLTVFLWVSLSVRKKRARRTGRGWRDRKGQGPGAKDSLWAELGSSAEERVEFWYTDGATVEEDKRKHRARQARTRKNGEKQVGTEEDMWIQPKVTLKDITEFWYANGRVRHDEETQCELNEE